MTGNDILEKIMVLLEIEGIEEYEPKVLALTNAAMLKMMRAGVPIPTSIPSEMLLDEYVSCVFFDVKPKFDESVDKDFFKTMYDSSLGTMRDSID